MERKRSSIEKIKKVGIVEEVDYQVEEDDGGDGAGSLAELEEKKKAFVGSGRRGSSCQAESCGADLTDAKRYYRRHKVCEFHSKAPTVMVAGLRQRFCQQCSRFHDLGNLMKLKEAAAGFWPDTMNAAGNAQLCLAL
ncbi:hypothetical protein L6164_022607 [Bauhinia variegata]|uniref:Uncharacterized protein n=1 Tax=Bauhinia variegata TaxID=167791 RepID=A0ACB9MFS5_BAUVA|nr:hypothetical protein L6164_022607 [Bauhinia variegata]